MMIDNNVPRTTCIDNVHKMYHDYEIVSETKVSETKVSETKLVSETKVSETKLVSERK